MSPDYKQLEDNKLEQHALPKKFEAAKKGEKPEVVFSRTEKLHIELDARHAVRHL